jgi:hypothetical protein
LTLTNVKKYAIRKYSIYEETAMSLRQSSRTLESEIGKIEILGIAHSGKDPSEASERPFATQSPSNNSTAVRSTEDNQTAIGCCTT